MILSLQVTKTLFADYKSLAVGILIGTFACGFQIRRHICGMAIPRYSAAIAFPHVLYETNDAPFPKSRDALRASAGQHRVDNYRHGFYLGRA
jgi:hypothetical protein